MTYTYKREDGTTFEVEHPHDQEPLRVCPQTKQKVRRIVVQSPRVIFKGEGWT